MHLKQNCFNGFYSTYYLRKVVKEYPAENIHNQNKMQKFIYVYMNFGMSFYDHFLLCLLCFSKRE